MEPLAQRRRFPRGLALAVLVYVGLRALILITAFDQVAMANYELYPMGTLPKGLALGGDFPLRLYYDNAAGMLLTGYLARISYWLFGENYLALKLVPACLGLGALVLVWAIAKKLWGERSALVAALLFAVGPTELATKYSVFASGNHFENLFFVSLALYAHYGLQRASAESRRRWLIAGGFTSGLALFVFLGAIIPVGLAALCHLGARGWRGAMRDLRYWLAPFVVGLAPLVLLNFSTGGRGGGFLEAKFGGDGNWALGRVWERMQSFVSEDMFEAGFHGAWGSLDWRVPSMLLLACLAVAWLVALPKALLGVWEGLRGVCSWERSEAGQEQAARRLELVPIVFLAPLATLAFGLSDLRIDRWPAPLGVAGFRYFLPVFLTGILLLAALVGRARVTRTARLTLLVAGLAGSTGLWNLRYLDPTPAEPGLGLRYSGYNFVQAARGLVGASNNLDKPTRVQYADSFPEFYRRQLYRGMGFHEAQLQLVTGQQRSSQKKLLTWLAGTPLDLEALLEGYPQDMHAQLALGAGEGLRTLAQSSKQSFEALASHVQVLMQAGHPLAHKVVEGLAVLQDFPLPTFRTQFLLARNRGLLSHLAGPNQVHFASGFGRLCGQLLEREIQSEVELVVKQATNLGKVLGRPFYVGLGQGLASASAQSRWTAAADRIVPAADLAAAKAAFEANRSAD
ncbi:MAG: 4-amino-4-deoxy-L-arabinose transferase-like glycosyltransferase [Planctomycetota bacterium]|jgi:4-amino-4-deoxy-L-arabinose transferase-like glycosyltransferase